MSRQFFDKRQHLPGRPPLDDSDYENFETHTVFNDLFIHADGRSISAVGPPWVNLAAVLLPLTLEVRVDAGWVRLVHRQWHRDRVSMHRFMLPTRLRGSTALDVRLTLANGLVDTRTVIRHCLTPVTLQFVTLQKNNPVPWIIDWIRYGQQLGVERFVVYDNASDNIATLADTLAALTLPVQVLLVDWPFGYGPVRSYYNQFCQASQNNHAHLCFGAAAWTGHFDVDEYLTTVAGPSLPDRLSGASRWTGLLRIDSHWVPRIESQGSDGMPSVRDFPFRERATRRRAHKYLVRNRALVMANTHNARVRLGYWRKLIPPRQMVFLHYKALTTSWRSYVTRGEGEPFDQARHCRDETVIKALADD